MKTICVLLVLASFVAAIGANYTEPEGNPFNIFEERRNKAGCNVGFKETAKAYDDAVIACKAKDPAPNTLAGLSSCLFRETGIIKKDTWRDFDFGKWHMIIMANFDMEMQEGRDHYTRAVIHSDKCIDSWLDDPANRFPMPMHYGTPEKCLDVQRLTRCFFDHYRCKDGKSNI